MSDPVRTIYKGTSGEPFEVKITRTTTLADNTTVSISVDRGNTFLASTWEGTADFVRTAQITGGVSNANLPTFPFDNRILAKVDGVIFDVGRVVGKVVPE